MQFLQLPRDRRIDPLYHCVQFCSVILIWKEASSDRSQFAPSTTCTSITTPNASTHTLTDDIPSTFCWIILFHFRTVSSSIARSDSSKISSSHLLVDELAYRLMNAVATQCYPRTGKWPMSFPQNENTGRLVSVSGTTPNALLRFQRSSPRSPNFNTQHSSSISHTFRWLTLKSVPQQIYSSLSIDQKPRPRLLKCYHGKMKWHGRQFRPAPAPG